MSSPEAILARRARVAALVPIVWGLSLALQGPGAAEAQTPRSSSRPVRALFGPTEAHASRPERLDLTLSMYGSMDDNSHFAPENSALDETLQARVYQGAQLGLMYGRRRPRARITVQGSSAVRYYSALRHVVTAKHGGGVSAEFPVSRAWDIQVSQLVSYSPYYQLALGQPAASFGAAELAMTSPDYSVSREKVMVYGSSVAVTYKASRRATVGMGYGLRYSNFFNRSDFSTDSAGTGLIYRFSRDVALRAGVGSASNREAGQKPVRMHNLDLGLDYQRMFRFSPQTSFAVTSGSTVVSAEDGKRMQITGAVRLSRQLAPHWALQVTYERAARTVENLPHPFFTHTLNGNVGGYATRRISMNWLPMCTKGVAVVGAGRSYFSCSSEAELNIALSRHWAVYAQDFYYHYRFSTGVELPPELARHLDRHGVRVGLTLWKPVIR